MESDPSIMPPVDLFPRLARAAHFARRLVHMLPEEAPLYMSNHYRGPVEPEQPHLPFVINAQARGIEDVEYPVYE